MNGEIVSGGRAHGKQSGGNDWVRKQWWVSHVTKEVEVEAWSGRGCYFRIGTSFTPISSFSPLALNSMLSNLMKLWATNRYNSFSSRSSTIFSRILFWSTTRLRSQRSGRIADPCLKNRWQVFDQLQFLNDNVTPRSTLQKSSATPTNY